MRYPIKSGPFEQDGRHAGYGVFDSGGYWFSTSRGALEFEDSPTAAKVADALNLAYDAGAQSVRHAIRDALCITDG